MVNLVAAGVETVRQQFPHEVRVIDHLCIPVGDGVYLSARVWLPEMAAAGTPVPAVIEYIPFRFTDFTAPRDQLIHPWFAGHGYASIRLELRGSGDSTGLPMDEYVVQEQHDALRALKWFAQQPWCDGNIGMFGMSWGAFSALQVAALKPPELKAIISVHGTDDRYRDDVHYMGGCLLLNNLSWGSQYQAYMARPPTPERFGDNWREAWVQRLHAAPLVLDDWLGHQARDTYWHQGSIAEDYDAIQVPTYVVGGWADGYAAAAMRMAQHLSAPKRVVVGPWAHTYPHIARPGPRIGFLQDATRWWDRWLKHIPNGIDAEPPLHLWLRDAVAPATDYDERPGRWLTFGSWPPTEVTPSRLWLRQGNRLGQSADAGAHARIKSPLTHAIRGGEWLPHGVGPEMPPDQQDEDRGALTFDGPLIRAPLDICGQVRLHLRVKVDRPSAHVYARLSVVRPDGQVTRITHGLLNLAFRDSFDQALAVTPGEWIRLQLPLIDVAERIPPGHRLRLSIGTQAWPLAWPAKDHSTLTLDLSACHIEMPVVREMAHMAPCDFGAPMSPMPLDLEWRAPLDRQRTVSHDPRTGTVTRRYLKDDGHFVMTRNGTALATSAEQRYQIQGADPLSAQAELEFAITLAHKDWLTRVTLSTRLRADRAHFYLDGRIELSESGNTVAVRDIERKIARITA